MASKTKRIILLSVSLVLVAILVLGFLKYNKGPRNVKNSKGIPVSAKVLYLLYNSDSLSAAKKYSGDVLMVTGEVHQVSENAQHQKVLLLKTESEQAYINCTLEESLIDCKQGDIVHVKGICNGIGQGYPDMGIKADVYLIRCFIFK
ncbi:MAG: hypothetical protein IPL84_03080 [Chitinophagaceae bacterium]|nr:hypothetical protein [Chitinophagaceae bacterium]